MKMAADRSVSRVSLQGSEFAGWSVYPMAIITPVDLYLCGATCLSILL